MLLSPVCNVLLSSEIRIYMGAIQMLQKKTCQLQGKEWDYLEIKVVNVPKNYGILECYALQFCR
jgi:predicted NUDIX family phosphoesterase